MTFVRPSSFHGGGWVIGDLDTPDNPCHFPAAHSGAGVLSVDYRLAPEDPFPAAVGDVWAAIYPVTQIGEETHSRQLFKEGFLLTRRSMDFFEEQYLPRAEDHRDPRVSILHADDLSNLPPAYIAIAGFDPLRDEGQLYAQKLRDAGTRVALRFHCCLEGLPLVSTRIGAIEERPAAMPCARARSRPAHL